MNSMTLSLMIWNAIRNMSKEDRAHWKAKFSKAQWEFMCDGMPW